MNVRYITSANSRIFQESINDFLRHCQFRGSKIIDIKLAVGDDWQAALIMYEGVENEND